MDGSQQPRKRLRQNPASQQPLDSHGAPTTSQAAWPPADAAPEPLPPKKKARKSRAGVKVVQVVRDFLRDHPWTPSPSTRHGDGPSRKAGPGAPGVVWPREQTIALIRLVVKTDMPINCIHTALRDETIGFTPGALACRRQWERMFHSPPEQARLQCPDGQKKRYRELKTAYELFARHQQALARGSFIPDSTLPPTELESVSAPQPTDAVALPTPPISPDEEQDNESVDTAKQHFNAKAVHGEVSQSKPAATEPKISSPTDQVSKGAKREPPKTREECAKRIDMDLQQLEWIMYGNRKHPVGRVRDSFRSRHSKHFSTDNSNLSKRRSTAEVEIPPLPTLFGSSSEPAPPLCQQLRRAYHLGCEPWTWNELAINISQQITNKTVNVADGDEHGITPLHLATAMGCLPVVAVLLAMKANPEALTDNNLSVSAYSRLFARDNRLSPEHIVHIETAREVVKYNAGLKDTEGLVRVKQSMVDAASQTDPKSNTRRSLQALQSISEDDTAVSQLPAAYSDEGALEYTGELAAHIQLTTSPYTDNRYAAAHQAHILQHDIPTEGHNAFMPPPPPPLQDKTSHGDTFCHSFKETCPPNMSPEIGLSSHYGMTAPFPSTDGFNAQAPPSSGQQKYGLPLTMSPNQSSSTLVPQQPFDNIPQRRLTDLQSDHMMHHGRFRDPRSVNESHTMPGPSTVDPAFPLSYPIGSGFIPSHSTASTGVWAPSIQQSLGHPPQLNSSIPSENLPGSNGANFGLYPPPHENYRLRHTHLSTPDQAVEHDTHRTELFRNVQHLLNDHQGMGLRCPQTTMDTYQPPLFPQSFPPQPGRMEHNVPPAPSLRSSQSVPAFMQFGTTILATSNPPLSDGFNFDFDIFHDSNSYSSGLPHDPNWYTRE